MNIYMIALRLIHVVSAVCWAGGTVVFLQFVGPSVKATGPASQTFLQYFMGRRKFSQFMSIAALLTILAGALLYWHDSSGLQSSWILTRPGIGFSIGAAFGVTVAIYGAVALGRRADRIGRLGQEVAARGGQPTAEQLAEFSELDEGMSRAGLIDFVLILIALVAMATARYW